MWALFYGKGMWWKSERGRPVIGVSRILHLCYFVNLWPRTNELIINKDEGDQVCK
jgi:hypothetical protein